jgi:hypothetical protein
VIIMMIMVVLAGAVIRWVRAGVREIRSSGERRIPLWLSISVVSHLAGDDGFTRLGRRGGSGGCVAVLGWVCGPAHWCSSLAEQCARQ